MLERTLYIILIFSFKLTFGQFSDSLILQCYNQEVYDFNFFHKNKIQRVDHYVYKGNNEKYLAYSIIYNKEKNIITKRLSTGSEDVYKEGVFGHPIICFEPGNDSSCIDNETYNARGRIIKDGSYRIEYDSLDRMVYIIDTTQNKLNYYRETLFKYNLNKLQNMTVLIYQNNRFKEKLGEDYFYKSPIEFGYNKTYPENWARPITKRVYRIKDNYSKLETIDYCDKAIVGKEIDIIVK